MRAVSFSALGLDGSLCLLIKLLPFSELAQEPGQGWAREDLGRQRWGNVARTSDPRGLFCTHRGYRSTWPFSWVGGRLERASSVFTVKKKFKKHVKPQVHVFSTSLESWLQLTPHVRRQVAAKETRCKQWLTCSRPSTMLGGNLTVEEREDVEA